MNISQVLSHTVLAAILSIAARAQVRIPGPGGPTTTGGSSTCTPVSGYAHCRVLTIDHTQVGGATLSNFGTLVTATLGGSRIRNANCYDVVFTADSGGTSEIAWEQEACNQSTGAILDWVGLSSISPSANTLFYVSYDNASITTAQNTGGLAPSHVWDGNYQFVLHLPNGATLSASDSTSNATSWTNTGSVAATPGQIDGAALFSGSNYLTGPNVSSLDGAAQFTLSFWANYGTLTPDEVSMEQYSGGGFFWENSTAQLYIGFSGGGYPYNVINGLPTVGSMHLYALAYDGTQSNASRLLLYYDGAVQTWGTVSTIPTTVPSTGGASFTIAGIDSTRFAGAMDEVRLSTGIARSAGWTMAEYNNQKSGSTFVTVGVEI